MFKYALSKPSKKKTKEKKNTLMSRNGQKEYRCDVFILPPTASYYNIDSNS
jgi:hypothetical protein